MKKRLAIGSEYLLEVCRILGVDADQASAISIHFDPDDLIWADIKMAVSKEQADQLLASMAAAVVCEHDWVDVTAHDAPIGERAEMCTRCGREQTAQCQHPNRKDGSTNTGTRFYCPDCLQTVEGE